MKSVSLNFLENSGPLEACNVTALPLLLHTHIDDCTPQSVIFVHTPQCVLNFVCTSLWELKVQVVFLGRFSPFL